MNQWFGRTQPTSAVALTDRRHRPKTSNCNMNGNEYSMGVPQYTGNLDVFKVWWDGHSLVPSAQLAAAASHQLAAVRATLLTSRV